MYMRPKALANKLGPVEALRFFTLVSRDHSTVNSGGMAIDELLDDAQKHAI